MKNKGQFKELIPFALRSIPYILQSHVFKAYCALEHIYANKPNLPESVWDYCTRLIRDDEPKVAGIIAPKLMEVEEIVDPTSGRDFGPDWILNRGLMPLSYWAMTKKIEEIGFPALFQNYLEQSLDHPRFLGHEISVLAGNWQFYKDVIAESSDTEERELFFQRFTEFVTTTFAQGNNTVFEHPDIDAVPPESEILEEALQNPGFFGHNVLAFVWGQRLKSIMTTKQYQNTLHNLTVLNRWQEFGKAPVLLDPISDDWDEQALDDHLIEFFLKGPTNIHQITLAEALLWTWENHPGFRKMIAANILCFTRGTQP